MVYTRRTGCACSAHFHFLVCLHANAWSRPTHAPRSCTLQRSSPRLRSRLWWWPCMCGRGLTMRILCARRWRGLCGLWWDSADRNWRAGTRRGCRSPPLRWKRLLPWSTRRTHFWSSWRAATRLEGGWRQNSHFIHLSVDPAADACAAEHGEEESAALELDGTRVACTEHGLGRVALYTLRCMSGHFV